MGKTNQPEKVKFFTGIIADSKDIIASITPVLEKEFGPVELKSEVIPFSFTDYYEKEMGKNLLRCWFGFKNLIDPGELAGIKIKTNNMETAESDTKERKINIDPGYLALSKIVLASTKDFSHRIYLSGGIFAEITMLYKEKTFSPLPWSYPDYNSAFAKDYFMELRQIYHAQLQQ